MRSRILIASKTTFASMLMARLSSLFYKRLNPGSLFPAAYEICVYPLAYSMAQLHRLRWQIGGAGALLLLGGFVASHVVALRFSAPVKNSRWIRRRIARNESAPKPRWLRPRRN